jgi:Mrp family chromosome partitioning ATPase
MAQLLKHTLQHYDNVVIDSPPVLGLADAPLLSSAVEGCIFVTESEGVAVRGIKTALGRLRAVHAQIFGVVLTKMKPKGGAYGYGYDYGYAYGRTTET